MATIARTLAGTSLFLLLTSGPAQAAQPLWQTLANLQQDLTRALTGTASGTWQALPAGTCMATSARYLEAQILRRNADAERSDPGLRLEAGVSEAIDAGFGNGRTRAHVGAAWNLLDEGRREHQTRANLLDARARAAALRARAEDRDLASGCHLQALEATFAPLQHRLLDLEGSLLTTARPVLRDAYFDDVVRLDAVLEIDRDIAANAAARAQLPAVAGGRPSATRPLPPLLDLNRNALDQRLARDPLPRQLAETQDTILAMEQELRTLDDQRLRLFARYEVDDIGRDDGGFVVGATVQWPLLRRAGAPPRLRRELATLSASQVQRQRHHAVADALRQFHRGRALAVQDHFNALRALERLRRTLAERSLPDGQGNLKLAVARARAALAAMQTLIDSRFRHHRAALRVFQAADLPWDASIVQAMRLPDAQTRVRAGNRDLYLWSSTLNRYPAGLLLDFALAKGIDRLLVSDGPTADREARAALIARAAGHGIAVLPLVATNAWAEARHHGQALQRLEQLVGLYGGVHLDVEPHTLPNWRTRQPHPVVTYLDLLQQARARLGAGAHIEVSAPLIWDAAHYVALDRVADRVHLMAYGTADPVRISRRLQPVLHALWGSADVVVALRVTDFANERQLEHTVDALAAEFPGVDFALHDTADYIDLVTRQP